MDLWNLGGCRIKWKHRPETPRDTLLRQICHLGPCLIFTLLDNYLAFYSLQSFVLQLVLRRLSFPFRLCCCSPCCDQYEERAVQGGDQHPQARGNGAHFLGLMANVYDSDCDMGLLANGIVPRKPRHRRMTKSIGRTVFMIICAVVTCLSFTSVLRGPFVQRPSFDTVFNGQPVSRERQ